MVSVKLTDATKRFEDTVALDHVNLTIKSGEFFFLLGPSGCGKTTLLRAIAGLGPLDSGEVLFDDKNITNVPPHKRNTSLVFQNYALWPHLSVFDNVAYGLVERKIPKETRKKKVLESLELVQLQHISERRPSQLSGGQQQRVALARALVVEPNVVLLDEPLSNLDAHLRNEMRYELKRIQSATGITMVYVTHDQKEALTMAHTIAVLQKGRLKQVGPPEKLYQNPNDIFVAQFVGRTNLVEGEVEKTKNGYVSVNTPIGTIWGRVSQWKAKKNDAVVCSIRPEAVRTTQPPPSQGDPSSLKAPPSATLKAKLLRRLFMGEIEERFYKVGDVELQSIELAPRGAPPSTESPFCLNISPDEVVILEKNP